MYIIVKYRSSLNLVIICKILVKLWLFFDLNFVVLIFVSAQQLLQGYIYLIAEGYIIIKYRSSSILVIISKMFSEIWPFFNLLLG